MVVIFLIHFVISWRCSQKFQNYQNKKTKVKEKSAKLCNKSSSSAYSPANALNIVIKKHGGILHFLFAQCVNITGIA